MRHIQRKSKSSYFSLSYFRTGICFISHMQNMDSSIVGSYSAPWWLKHTTTFTVTRKTLESWNVEFSCENHFIQVLIR